MVKAVASTPTYPWLKHYPEGIDWAESFPVTTLPALFEAAAAQYGSLRCLDFMDKHTTYRELARQVDQLAEGLQKLGLGKGDRIGLFLPNVPYFVIAYFAILKIGATVVNFNPLYAEHEIVHQIDDSDTALMITLDLKVLYDKLAPLLGQTCLKRILVCRMADCLPFAKSMLFGMAKRSEIAHIPFDDRHLSYTSLTINSGKPKPVSLDPLTDIAVIQYTGGTTGVPKGAMLTHANLTINARQCLAWVPMAQPGKERMLAVLPFFHVFAMTVALNTAVLLGAEIVLMPRFDLDELLALIDSKQPTMLPAVPTIYAAINSHPKRGDHDLTSIRCCISGGAPLPVEVKHQFEAATGCVVIEGYGLSEASPVIAINPINGPHKEGSVGLPVPGTVIEIISLEDGVTPVAAGERGQVCVRGPQVMAGYWRRPDDTARTIRDGLLATGDVGVMDEQGFVFIVDRIKDLILAGGFNVYPRNVEEAIYQHPAVEEAVVAGLPDPYRGQTVKAYLKLAEGAALTEAELLAFLEDKLSPIEMPKLIEFRAELPKTLVGKLSRKDLLEEEKLKAAAVVGDDLA